jgi:hypothetical protein
VLLPLLVFACIGYAAHAWAGIAALRRRADGGEPPHLGQAVSAFIVPVAVPVSAMLTMVWLFWFVGVAPTVQLNAGDDGRMNAWSTWVGLWELFVLLAAVSSLGNLGWLVACGVKKELRKHLATAAAALGLSLLAFFTVATHFPSA